MNEELLISLVKKYPELYNQAHPDYQDIQRAINIWEEIAEIMNETPLTCKDRWKRIRDNFRRAYLFKISKSGQMSKNLKPIRFYNELSFYTPYIRDNEQTTSKQQTINENDEKSKITESVTVTVPVAPITASVPAATLVRVSEKKRKPPVEEASSIQSVSQPSTEKKCCDRDQEEDSTVFFFKSLGKTVQTFPSDLKIRVKRAVFGIVSEAEEELVKINDAVQSTFTCKQEPI